MYSAFHTIQWPTTVYNLSTTHINTLQQVYYSQNHIKYIMI